MTSQQINQVPARTVAHVAEQDDENEEDARKDEVAWHVDKPGAVFEVTRDLTFK